MIIEKINDNEPFYLINNSILFIESMNILTSFMNSKFFKKGGFILYHRYFLFLGQDINGGCIGS